MRPSTSRNQANGSTFASCRKKQNCAAPPPSAPLSLPKKVQLLRQLQSGAGKLEWYRAGNESSERQWNDLRNIRNTAGHSLDLPYLRKWAADLSIADLLEKLLSEPQLERKTPARA